MGVAAVPNSWRRLPRSTVAAAGLLAAYCVWSYASVAWAADPGAAWQGANRTVVFLAAFVLFASWRQRPATAGVLLGVWTTAVTVLAAIVAVRLLRDADPRLLLPGGRLLFPAGYANATAALLMMAFFGALTCAAARPVPWPVRALAAGAAVLLADVALLAVSRGSLLATPICLGLLLVLLPGRLRRVAALLPVGAAVAFAAPRLIEVTDVLGRFEPPPGVDEARAAGLAIMLGAMLAAGAVGAVALLEQRRPPSAATARALRRGGSGLVAASLVAFVVGGLVVVGNPVTRLDNAWSSFKGGYTEYSGNRLGSGLGSNRYDFYRVSVRAFRNAPLVGIGADNFYETYLLEGSSQETPRYPHSLQLRTLAETGLVGALLLFGALAAALPAAVRAAASRRSSEAAQAVAAGALMASAYWVVHGSADWFFEYGGLGAAAFGTFGLAASLDPARAAVVVAPATDATPSGVTGDTARGVARVPRRAVLAVVGAAALIPALALLAQWAADRDVTRAGQLFAVRSGEAYERLERARRLDPFGDTADSVAGSIAVRLGDPERALRSFKRALKRSPDDQYSQLQVGSIQSALGRPGPALRSLERAVALAPRDRLARDALAVVRGGDTIDLTSLTARIAARGASER